VLAQYGVRVLGTSTNTIRLAEDRQAFADLMTDRGQPVLAHGIASDLWGALDFAQRHGYPVVVRAPFCLGGTGSGHASTPDELEALVRDSLRLSPVGNVLLERSVLGWAEIEYEVLRDAQDNAIIICNMENMDPMGVHTGESIVVAPSQTLSDGDYQRLRTTALNIVRALGVRGSCNCQFGLNQQTGEVAVIEVNPRLSRSSALASKATGYPIARVAAKIALGYTLAELRNDITGASACAEPALDYVVAKLPRWPFDKFRDIDHHIGMTMKSTGEVMAIGRSFEQAFLKALRSLDTRSSWLEVSPEWTHERIVDCFRRPTPERPAAIYNALAQGWSVRDISQESNIHPWFIERFAAIHAMEQECREGLSDALLAEAKRLGIVDEVLVGLAHDGVSSVQGQLQLRQRRRALGIIPTYKMVDTCAGEFAATTPYFYSTYEREDEADALSGPKVIVLGSGPIRIGQGIEFDYFEPLTFEEVLNVVEHEQEGLLGVIAQFGGQTALNLIRPLVEAGVTILGTPPGSIATTEDRKLMAAVCEELDIPTPAWSIAHSQDELEAFAPRIGAPLLRAWRARDADRAKPRRARGLPQGAGRAPQEPACAGRPLPRRCCGDRRRRRIGWA
jgi:carbamoyl-phosphate synthase large subunit